VLEDGVGVGGATSVDGRIMFDEVAAGAGGYLLLFVSKDVVIDGNGVDENKGASMFLFSCGKPFPSSLGLKAVPE
jgi:hypothetical protein